MGDAEFHRGLHGGFHLFPGFDPDSFAQTALETGEDQVGHQEKPLAFPDNLGYVQFFPVVRFGHGRIAPAVQFHADDVGLFFPDDPADFFNAFPGNMGGSDEDDSGFLEL